MSMKFLFLIFLISIPQLISCNEFQSTSGTKKMPQQVKESTFKFVLYNSYILFFAFIIVLFINICCKDCMNSYTETDNPRIWNIVVHAISFELVFSVSICYFIGAAKPKPKYDSDINELFNSNLGTYKELYNKISKLDDYYNASSLSLKVMALNYNYTFSIHNPKYQKAFNDILYNPKPSNYLKVSLKQMDNSRNTILSKIISFTDEYASFSQSIQKFNDQTIILNSNSIFSENSFNNVGSKSYYSFVSYPGSIIMGILIMIVNFLYLVIFFIKKHFADVFLCLFPLFAAGLITGGTLTGVYLKYDDYFNIYYDCEKLHSRSFNTKKKNLTNYGIVGKKIDFFQNNNEIKTLFESINAKTVHKNYFDIYTQYSKNIDFKDSLEEIYSTIKQSKKQLRQMKKLLNEISSFGFSIYQNVSYLHNISNEIIYELSNSDEKIQSNCISIIKGSNCFINGSLVLLLVLVVMFFSIFIRRTKPNDYKVENGQRGQGNYDFEAGKKHVWLFAYSYWPKSTIVRDGEYGKGIYF